MTIRAFLGSSAGLVVCLLLAALGGWLLWSHTGHVLLALPYLILLACPLMHFMHRGHYHHGNNPSCSAGLQQHAGTIAVGPVRLPGGDEPGESWLHTRHHRRACRQAGSAEFQARSDDLPTGATVPVEFVTKTPGEYAFACPMGMFRGRLIFE